MPNEEGMKRVLNQGKNSVIVFYIFCASELAVGFFLFLRFLRNALPKL